MAAPSKDPPNIPAANAPKTHHAAPSRSKAPDRILPVSHTATTEEITPHIRAASIVVATSTRMTWSTQRLPNPMRLRLVTRSLLAALSSFANRPAMMADNTMKVTVATMVIVGSGTSPRIRGAMT